MSWRSSTWLCVHASSNTRSASRRSRYFSISARQSARWSPTPTTRSTITVWSGCSVIAQRLAATGSSTEPWEFDSASSPNIAAGARRLPPRPMKRARSVSCVTGVTLSLPRGG